jgi:opacity protein-like surface antigen
MEGTMRQATTAAVVLAGLVCGQVNAGTMGPVVESHGPKNGLYLGAGIGGNFNSDTLESISLTSMTSVSVTSDKSYTVGNLYAGYGHTFANSWFFGLEANTYFPRRTINIISPAVSPGDTNRYANQLTFHDYLAVDALPGYNINPNLLVYGRAGASFRDTTISQNQDTWSNSYLNAYNSVGGRVGAGIAYGFTEHVGVAVDYVYTSYREWGSQWDLYLLKFNAKSHANYVGVSLVATV